MKRIAAGCVALCIAFAAFGFSDGSVSDEYEDDGKERVIPLEDQFVHITRAEIALGDYFCFLRLPIRVRQRFKMIADAYYEHLKKQK